jgi:imidazolonepropionase
VTAARFDLIVRNARIHPMSDGIGLADFSSLGVRDGRIAACGVAGNATAKVTFDAAGRVLMPGLIDCHTHAIYAGNRMHERAMKLRGASYADIAKAGGGIVSTVKAVRETDVGGLLRESLGRIRALLAEGVTTLEIKSGYGLTSRDEIKMLRAARRVADHLPLNIVTTFLGAHAIPAGRERADYMREVVDEMLPAVAAAGVADLVDIFVEHIAFDVDDMRHLFAAARHHGLGLRAHTDQLSNMGGTRAAAEMGALSCDHLEYTSDADIQAMARNDTVAVLLPGAFYCLGETRKPPVEAFRKAGVPMAVASDLNPGSSPVASLLAPVHMAANLFGLHPEEALLGITRNAAAALGRAGELGSIEVGKRADFGLWDIPGPEFLIYQLGGVRPAHVFSNGRKIRA